MEGKDPQNLTKQAIGINPNRLIILNKQGLPESLLQLRPQKGGASE
jgi:hypothetical protein